MPRQTVRPKKTLSIRLTEELLEQVTELAVAKSRTLTWVVERSLEDYCRRELKAIQRGEHKAA